MPSKKPYFLEEVTKGGDRKLLCVHGLNQNANALKPFLKDLGERGVHSFLLHLPEHAINERLASKDSVFQSYSDSYSYLESQYGQVDYFVGYSFGGLIGTSLLPKHTYKKMLLLAPALKVRPYTLMLKPALPFLRVIRSIPLGGDQYEKYYRHHTMGAPKSVYESFFQTYSYFQKNTPEEIQKTEAMVLCHPKDELIHSKKLETWVKKKTPWEFQYLSNEKADFRRYNHLCFDTQTLGTESYKKLLRASEALFNLS